MATAPASYSVAPAPAAFNKVTIANGDTFLQEGDSTSNDTPVTGLYAWWSTRYRDRLAVLLPGLTLVNGGVNGDTIEGVRDRIIADLTGAGANGMMMSIGSNNVFNGTSAATYRAAYDTTLDLAINTYGLNPAKIGCCGVYFRGSEAWDTGPVYNGAFEAKTVELNAEAQASCLARGVRWIPWRDQLIFASVNYNRSKLTTGVLSLDGTHFITLGKDVSGDIVLDNYVTVVP